MAEISKFWRRTPPALFPSLLGLFGLALAWRLAAKVWAVPAEIGETIGLVATLLLLVTLSSYVTKLCIRPSVLWDDLKIGPARGSVSAGSMCAMAMAAFLVPYSSLGAFVVWWLAIVLHAVYFTCVALMVLRHDNTKGEIAPTIILPAVGIMLSSLAAPALGYPSFALIVLLVTIPVSAIILLICLHNARDHGVPPPQRSSFAIFLAPPAVAALGLHLLYGNQYLMPTWIGASLVALALVPYIKWMTHGGWNPGWGAFTFPIAAFAGVQLLAANAGFGIVAVILATISLGLATFLVPYIVARTYQMWFQGRLAEATKAAVA